MVSLPVSYIFTKYSDFVKSQFKIFSEIQGIKNQGIQEASASLDKISTISVILFEPVCFTDETLPITVCMIIYWIWQRTLVFSFEQFEK